MKKSSSSRKLTTLTLVAATYCMVAGGPFGLEEIVQKGGYGIAVWILIFVPVVWSFPTALVVSELSTALPKEGGFYVWVERAMGPFWGFQEAWLSLVGSIFDMAIYPTLFAWYLARLWPFLESGNRPLVLGFLMIGACLFWNLQSAGAIGRGSALITLLVHLPFVAAVALALGHSRMAEPGSFHPEGLDFLGGVVIAMWNYMGWDNAATVAGEVDKPRQAYPRAMAWSHILVSFSYLIPVLAAWKACVPLDLWQEGGWVDISRALGGPFLAAFMAIAGALAAAGTFNALKFSLTRLPLVMAEDGFLPKAFAYKHPRTGAPVVSVLVCTVAWSAVLTLGFDRIVMMDVLLTGLSILLEFAALVVLRVREPKLPRPYKVPGGLPAALALCVGPTALLVLCVLRTAQDAIGHMNALAVAAILVVLGPILYWSRRRGKLPIPDRVAG